MIRQEKRDKLYVENALRCIVFVLPFPVFDPIQVCDLQFY